MCTADQEANSDKMRLASLLNLKNLKKNISEIQEIDEKSLFWEQRYIDILHSRYIENIKAEDVLDIIQFIIWGKICGSRFTCRISY